jgi:glutamate formiminotransferase
LVRYWFHYYSIWINIKKGPSEFIPTWGATCVGARKFLIAYNINLLGTKEQAHRIALNVREQGRSKEEVNIYNKKKKKTIINLLLHSSLVN